jgi:orotidine-5'-phosphate decarboxylase
LNFADLVYEREVIPLVVGIDPHFHMISDQYLPASGVVSAESLASGIVSWMTDILEAVGDLVRVVKFQSALFEQFGSVGIRLLSEGIRLAKDKGLVVILDCKRGDIGSTATAYASYLRGGVEGRRVFQSDLEVDAMTVNPFLGNDTLEPFLAEVGPKGIFVLVRTSNPGSGTYQKALIRGTSVAEELSVTLEEMSLQCMGKCGFSAVGAVVGATYPEELVSLRLKMPHVLFLVPGVGAQGGKVDVLGEVTDTRGRGALVNVSRAVTFPDCRPGERMVDAVRSACHSYLEALS